jgi:hypothetical protein
VRQDMGVWQQPAGAAVVGEMVVAAEASSDACCAATTVPGGCETLPVRAMVLGWDGGEYDWHRWVLQGLYSALCCLQT